MLLLVATSTRSIGDTASQCDRDLEAIKHSASAVLPWEADLPGIWWEARAKYYVISAVDSIRGTASADLKFAVNDAALLGQHLCRLGFEPAGGLDDAVLTGSQATADNVVKAAKVLQHVTGEREPVLLYYYSGHGLKDAPGTKLALQFWDQDEVSVADGTSLAEVLSRIRAALPQFQLLVVIDACFSGAALALAGIDPSLLDGVTLLMSSAKNEFSKPVARPDGTEVSAFTGFVLDILQNDEEWHKADNDHDGLLWAEDLFHFTTDAFKRLAKDQPNAFQTPKYTAFGQPQLVAYDRTRLQNAQSARRGSFIRVSVQLARAVDGSIMFGTERLQPADVQLTLSAGGKTLGAASLSSLGPAGLALESVLQLRIPGPPSGQLTYALSTKNRILTKGSFNLAKSDAVLLVDAKNESLLTAHEGKAQRGGGGLSGLAGGGRVVLEKMKVP